MAEQWLDFGVSDVWQKCRDHGIDPDGNGKIRCWVEPYCTLTLYDSEDPLVSLERAFVLFSPESPNKVISRTLAVRKQKRLPSGFLVNSARQHQKVFVVGPFSDAELAPLVQAGIQVRRVPGDTPKEISDNLLALAS